MVNQLDQHTLGRLNTFRQPVPLSTERLRGEGCALHRLGRAIDHLVCLGRCGPTVCARFSIGRHIGPCGHSLYGELTEALFNVLDVLLEHRGLCASEIERAPLSGRLLFDLLDCSGEVLGYLHLVTVAVDKASEAPKKRLGLLCCLLGFLSQLFSCGRRFLLPAARLLDRVACALGRCLKPQHLGSHLAGCRLGRAGGIAVP